MFGREQYKGTANLKAKIFYLIYGIDQIGDRTRAFHITNYLKQRFKEQKSLRILDAGCGVGAYSFWCERNLTGAAILGVDKSNNNIELCQRILSASSPKTKAAINFKQKDLIDLSEAIDAKFDLIICVDVLEYIKDDQHVLSNFYNILADGGQVVFHVGLTPVLYRHTLLKPDNTSAMKDKVRDNYREEEIIRKIEAAGFKIAEKRYTFGRFGSLAREMFLFIQKVAILRTLIKLVLFSVFLATAYFDWFCENKTHQGFLFILEK